MLKTVIISIVVIICTLLIVGSLSKINKYVVLSSNKLSHAVILDTQTGTSYIKSGDSWRVYTEFKNK